jgi:MOSC domain-containing protein YiiM
VLREGDIGAGDPIDRIAEDENRIAVADIVGLREAEAPDQDLLRRASRLPALPESWRESFRQRLADLGL